MEELVARLWSDLGERIEGPMTFRFVLQPLIAIFLGLRDELRLGREGVSVIGFHEQRKPGRRRILMRAMWRSIRVLVLVALTFDLMYQLLVLHWFYPGEAIIVGAAITVAPCKRSIYAE